MPRVRVLLLSEMRSSRRAVAVSDGDVLEAVKPRAVPCQHGCAAAIAEKGGGNSGIGGIGGMQ